MVVGHQRLHLWHGIRQNGIRQMNKTNGIRQKKKHSFSVLAVVSSRSVSPRAPWSRRGKPSKDQISYFHSGAEDYGKHLR